MSKYAKHIPGAFVEEGPTRRSHRAPNRVLAMGVTISNTKNDKEMPYSP
jgi:hypothetical protein